MRRTAAALITGAFLIGAALPALAAGNDGVPPGYAWGNCKDSAGGGKGADTTQDPNAPVVESGYGGWWGKYKHADGCVSSVPDDGGDGGSDGGGDGGDGDGGGDGDSPST